MHIEPQRAPVKPRVRTDDGGTVPLENEILPQLHEDARGVIAIIGGTGSGRSTAMRHLACFISPESRVLMVDDSSAFGNRDTARVLVYTGKGLLREGSHLAVFNLASWSNDDLIEYLLAKHKDKCASVMKRVNATDGARLLGGNPELWSVVLDEMASDESITRFSDALLKFLKTRLDDDLISQARRGCLCRLALDKRTLSSGGGSGTGVEPGDWDFLDRIAYREESWRLLRHEAVQMLLAREQILTDLRGGAPCDYLKARLTRTFVRLIAVAAGRDPVVSERLRKLALDSNLQATAGSILHATGIKWVPDKKSGLNIFAKKIDLSGAYLECAQWPEIVLTQAECDGADFSHADLSAAHLNGVNANGGNFRRAKLRRAQMKEFHAKEANFAQADLSNAACCRAVFAKANLSGANLEAADLSRATLVFSNLTGARLCRADLRMANLVRATIEGADFSRADFTEAELSDLRLREANIRGATFESADMRRCDLEFMELPGAIFKRAHLQNALLTGTFIPRGCFYKASLRCAGLADIDWERADLREADLTGCTFHMGSSRSGRIYSDIACEGSRTGFYTDEYFEQSYRAPEQIRKANLRGADLRGAKIEDVDFYLVDLREALYDLKHTEHLRRCGAILETRV